MMAMRYPIGCTLGLMLGGLALQAMAEPPATPTTNNGLMTFPHVRVVNAPLPASVRKPAARESGMRAYMKDGQMMEASAADAAQLSNATRAPATKATAITGAASATTQDDAQMIYGPDNSVEIMLGEDSMVFQTAHKDAAGKLTQQCVTGEDSAAHALHSAPAKKERHNDR
jgi:hypothetical protein